MAQDYSAWFDSMDFPPWRADVPGDGTDALGLASAKVWPRILSVARRESAKNRESNVPNVPTSVFFP